MIPTRPTTASPTLVEHRFLVSLRREHQIVEVVLRCVFLKGLNVSFQNFFISALVVESFTHFVFC